VFSPADVVNNNLLLSICTFLNCNWNLWGGPETRHLCRLGDLILDVYVQPEVTIDLTVDEPEDDQQQHQEWIVLDELYEEDSPGSESEESDDEAPDMLLDFNAVAEELASESDFSYDSHSESDYSTSESEDSGIEF
jgi:hypothetical protein